MSVIEQALDRFDIAVEAESKNREDAIEDLKFRDGDQWPDQVKRDREHDGRPCLTLNRCPAYVRQIVNDIRQSRPAIKIRGVDSESDPETAEIINGMVRTIEQGSNAEIAYDWAAEYAVTMGWGYIGIYTRYVDESSFDQEPYIRRIRNPFSVYMDPNAQEPDASDAMWAFEVDFMDRKTFKKKYPDADDEWPDESQGTHQQMWFTKDKVRIAGYWVVEEEEKTLYLLKDGTVIDYKVDDLFIATERRTTERKVKRYLMTGTEILEEIEWPGKYIPLVPVLGQELDIEGEIKLSGMVRDLKDTQRQYNYWRSASTERVALAPKAPFIGAVGMFQSPKWKSANQKNYPYLEYEPVDGHPPPRREMPPDISPGIANEIATAAQEFKDITGIFRDNLGDQSNAVSGIAVRQRQGEGDVSNFHYVDNLARAMRHVGRILVDLIPKLYDTERVVNILKPDGTEEKVQINTEYVDQKTMKPKLFDLRAGKYDVVIDTGPSYSTQRQEAAEQMTGFIQAYPQSAPLIGDLLAKNMDWPESDEIAKRLRLMLPADIEADENPQIQALVQQFQGQIDQLKQYAGALEQELQNKDQELNSKKGELQIKQGELESKFAELERKYEEMYLEFEKDMTKLELDANKNVPGSAV